MFQRIAEASNLLRLIVGLEIGDRTWVEVDWVQDLGEVVEAVVAFSG